MGFINEPAKSLLYPETVAAAEQCIISLALFSDGDSALSCAVEPRMFFNPRLGTVFAAARAAMADGKAPDLITVADELERTGYLEPIGGLAYLSSLALCAASMELLDRYCELVKEAWTGRELRRIAAEVPSHLDNGAGVQEVSDRLRAFIDRIESINESATTTLDVEIVAENGRIAADLVRMQGGALSEAGLPTGLGLESIVPGGIPRDRLTLLFGETGTYKTAIKQWISDAIAKSGKYVLDFTLEDSTELTAQRFLARHTGIPYGRIAARELAADEVQLLGALEPLAHAVASRTIVVGSVPATIEEAIRLSRYWARKVPLAACFVDYIQLLETKNRDNEAQSIYETCKKAQRAAHRDKLAWILVSQMNRRYADRPDKRPTLADLYGGSAIGHTTKLAVGIYRPYLYEMEPPQDSPFFDSYHNHPDGKQKYKGALELVIRKNVAGEAGVSRCVFVDPPTGRMSML